MVDSFRSTLLTQNFYSRHGDDVQPIQQPIYNKIISSPLRGEELFQFCPKNREHIPDISVCKHPKQTYTLYYNLSQVNQREWRLSFQFTEISSTNLELFGHFHFLPLHISDLTVMSIKSRPTKKITNISFIFPPKNLRTP